MIKYSNPILISLRTVGQKLGVLRPAVRLFRRIFNLSYENGFDKEMMSLISQNEVIWDVGANVGYFTKKFSQKIGNDGRVVALEPSPGTYKTLLANCENLLNVTCMNVGLSNKTGKFSFRVSGVENDVTNCLAEDGTPGSVVVEVVTGDDLLSIKSIPVPNVVKIDVEGFEIDVIQGMRTVLINPKLNKLFVEVHFLEMSKRGIKNGSMEMVQIVRDAGFVVKWTDPSHFIATRKV